MPIHYDPHKPLLTAFFSGRLFAEVCRSRLFWFMILVFFTINGFVLQLDQESLIKVNDEITWPATLVASLFSYMLALFTNNCYERYKDNWRAAMGGWSRLNDLGLQMFAHVDDRSVACDVMRMMHAANHLCYGEFAGHDVNTLVLRRNLLSEQELESLKRAGGNFYLCACWALEKMRKSGVNQMMVPEIDRTIREWRQFTTSLLLIQLTPLPLPYFRIMIILTFTFQSLVATKLTLSFRSMAMALAQAEELKRAEGETGSLRVELPWGLTLDIADFVMEMNFALSFAMYFLISLIVSSIVLTAIQLLQPWSKSALDLPAEEYLLLPVAAHRNLFAAPFAGTNIPPVINSIFVRPLDKADEQMLAQFGETETAKAKQQLSSGFRELDSFNTVRLSQEATRVKAQRMERFKTGLGKISKWSSPGHRRPPNSSGIGSPQKCPSNKPSRYQRLSNDLES